MVGTAQAPGRATIQKGLNIPSTPLQMPKLTQQEYIRQELQALLEKKGLSQNELARMTDVSAANISHILNGRTDKTVSEEIWNKVAAPLGALNGLHLLTTAGYKAVVATCEAAQADCTLSIVLGQPGHGKTAALRHYFKQQPNVYFTEFWYSMSRREFFVAEGAGRGRGQAAHVGAPHSAVRRQAERRHGQPAHH
jgi:predicted XRE-type DNA-binding protein